MRGVPLAARPPVSATEEHAGCHADGLCVGMKARTAPERGLPFRGMRPAAPAPKSRQEFARHPDPRPLTPDPAIMPALFRKGARMARRDKLLIFAGSASPKFAAAICDELGVAPGKCDAKHFSEGNTFVRVLENVRGKDVFFVRSL